MDYEFVLGRNDFPPDAQAEIAKRDARIESLTSAGAEYQRQCFEQAARIKELEATCEEHRQYALDAYLDDEDSALAKLAIRNHEQAAEIARLKGVIAKCKEVLISNTSDLQEPNFVTLADWRVREALAAIKEEGL